MSESKSIWAQARSYILMHGRGGFVDGLIKKMADRGEELERDRAQLTEAVRCAARWFREYEKLHRAKSPPDHDKAETNAIRAVALELGARLLDGVCEHGALLDTYCAECDKP